METNSAFAFVKEGSGSEKDKRLPKPPKLRRICSLSTALPAPEFFRLLKDAEVTAVLDTRLSREYDGARFAHEKDFKYIVELHGITYLHAKQFSPTPEMRKQFDLTFKGVKTAAARDTFAWTRFLEQYEHLLMERKVLQQDPQINRILYGDHEAVAILCHCPHHDDCHRSYACGIIANYIEGVELRILYDRKEPTKASPRRYRLHDFPHARLRINARLVVDTRSRGGK